ncbi:MAG: DUF2027 domain-containing protein [Bacteroidales bacterium]|nr:DUF2027 domain-containing protein [Bacteroidales bacterium]
MEIGIGDKVRFLDAIGGGVVTAFKGKDMVVVLEEDGFETPVFKRQCVVIDQTPVSIRKPEPPKQEVPKPIVPKPLQPKAAETREGEYLSIYLAYLPCSDKPFTEAEFECYLINDSNYTLMFNYASCSGKSWKSRATGMLEPNSKLFVEEFKKESILELEKISLQGIAFKPDTFYSFKNTFSVEIRLDTVKFYKIHCFRENDYFQDDALIVPVVKKDVPEKSLLISGDEIARAMHEKEPEAVRMSEPLPKKKQEIFEVDLHIDRLLDTTAGMSHSDILKYQMEIFFKTMEEHRSKKAFKVIFIHGKGDGVLRASILNELRTKYKSCKWQDASFREYGFGATMVTIY